MDTAKGGILSPGRVRSIHGRSLPPDKRPGYPAGGTPAATPTLVTCYPLIVVRAFAVLGEVNTQGFILLAHAQANDGIHEL
jgi:hypothetical protein